MFCPNCGAFIADNAAFCPNCGIGIAPTPQVVVVQQPKKRHTFLGLVLTLLGLYWIFSAVGGLSFFEDLLGYEESAVTSTAPVRATSYAFGDTCVIDGLEFTVNSFVFSSYAGNLHNFNPSGSDYRYCVVYLDAKNTTNNTKKLVEPLLTSYTSDYSFTLVYDGGAEYHHSYGSYTDFLFANEEILPLASLSNKVISFKVPVEVASSDKSLTLVLKYKEEVKARWTLR